MFTIKLPAITITLRSPISIRVSATRQNGTPRLTPVQKNYPCVDGTWYFGLGTSTWAILSTLKSGQTLRSSELVHATGVDYKVLASTLARLVKAGVVVRVSRGRFMLPHALSEQNGKGVVTR